MDRLPMLLAIVSLACVAAATLEAQRPTLAYRIGADTALPVARGAKVRVVYPATTTQPERFTAGYLYRLAGDSVVVARGLARDTIALTGGRTLRVVVRSRGHGGTGAIVGALGGAVISGAVASATWEPCTDTGWFACLWHPSRGSATAAGAVGGVLLGGALGFAIGSAVRTEEWGTIPIPGARVAVMANGVEVRAGF